MKRHLIVAALLVFCLNAVAPSQNVEATKLQSTKLGSTPNVHGFGKILLCGQPSAKDFAEAKERGFKVIVTLRTKGEVAWDEPATIKELGLEFHRFGFRAPDTLSDAIFNDSLKVLAQSEKSPVMLHCGSANRVGAIWLAHRVLNDGLDLTVARKEAATVGLRTPGYETRALDYIKRRLADRSSQEPYLAAPRHVAAPRIPGHASTNRAFQGIPSMAVSPGGRLWADWYAGVTPGEDHNNYVVVSTSGDNGRTWKEVLVIDPDGDGPVRAFDPELWQAPDGRLFVFWAQAAGHDGTVAGVWCIHTNQPNVEQPAWSKPRRLTDGIMMCKPVVLSSGEWVLPASTWRKTDSSAKMIVSKDQGKTWALCGACNVPSEVRAFDEHIITERRDGSLWLLARTRYGIGQSVSTDRGVTWPDLKPSAIAHPSARFFVRRLKSGNLLLVKHGAIDQRSRRSHLTAYVSSDDGRSWKGGLLLDVRGGVSYPDGQQTDDGLIRIIYDFSRTDTRHILMATFREQDVAAGKAVSDDIQLRQLVSEATGGR